MTGAAKKRRTENGPEGVGRKLFEKRAEPVRIFPHFPAQGQSGQEVEIFYLQVAFDQKKSR